jgi:shikimate kinase
MIFIIGMPGSGKSYWGSTIANAYGLSFIDLDSCIERKINMPVADYFTSEGEAAFRQVEHECLIESIETGDNNTVVACGGGTPVFHNNMRLMKEAGCTVYLKAPLNIIMKRLERSPTRRPLLEGKDLATALMELYEQRHACFSEADYIFELETVSVANFEKIVETCTNLH